MVVLKMHEVFSGGYLSRGDRKEQVLIRKVQQLT